MMFLRLQTQWHSEMGVYKGLNYQSLEWLCGIYKVEDPAAMFEGVRTMEAAALEQMMEDRGND